MAGQVTVPQERHNPVAVAVQRLLAAVVVVLVILAVFLAVFVRHDAAGQSTFMGRPVFSVASGSMSPTFNTGDLIIDKPISLTAAEHLHKGQIITFKATTTGGTSSSALLITHRIYAVVKGPVVGGVSTVQYRTKGDANNAPDLNLVSPSAIQGVYQQRVPFGGYVLSALHQPITFVILIMIPVAYLIGEEIRKRWIALGEAEARRREAQSQSLPGS